ncbi:acyl-CoA dehydrogenase [Myxococcaceae bacterium]|jgi:alkylation response protein AidB-like acyl-CoA dehydrogenase|nr:acyl-CoA dehydrogenase [Myxococcaceae bacterium]
MNFDFSEDQKLVQKTARDYLAEHSPLGVCRRVLEGKELYDATLWKGVAEMGWLGAAIPEEYGGAGLGHLELVLIAEEIGRALAPIPFSSSVYLASEALLLAGSEDQKKKHLPRLASGELIATLALAEGAGDPDLASLETRLEGGRLSGRKLPVVDGDVAGAALVLARDGKGHSLVWVDLGGSGVSRSSLDSLDPSRSQAEIVFAGAPAEVVGKSGEGARLVERLLDRAAVLMAFEQLGGAQRALEITREYAMGRYAFGRPIASFQGLKHRFAELYCAIELARSNAYYGAWALSHGNDELSLAACGARISACKAFELAGEEMIQIHGGVGYTWEYDCHLFYRRSKLLSLALGSPSDWREKLVCRLEARDAA